MLQSHGLVAPHLDGLIIRSTHNQGILSVLVELHARHPVSVGILIDCELALTHCVPNLELFVSSSAGNLSVIGGESNS